MNQERVFLCIMLIFNVSVVSSTEIELKVTKFSVPEMKKMEVEIDDLVKKASNLIKCIPENQEYLTTIGKFQPCKEELGYLVLSYSEFKENYKKEIPVKDDEYIINYMNERKNSFTKKNTHHIFWTIIESSFSSKKTNLLKGTATLKIVNIENQDYNKFDKKKIPCKIKINESAYHYNFREVINYLTNQSKIPEIIPARQDHTIEALKISTELEENDNVIKKIKDNFNCMITYMWDGVASYEFEKKKTSGNKILI